MKANDTPAPGTYYRDEVLIKCLKNLNKGQILIQNDRDNILLKDLGIGLKDTVEKLGFTVKAKRFKYKGMENLGPGSYFPKIENRTTNGGFSMGRKKENIINGPDRSSYPNIPSIPLGKDDFGFTINPKTGEEFFKLDHCTLKESTGNEVYNSEIDRRDNSFDKKNTYIALVKNEYYYTILYIIIIFKYYALKYNLIYLYIILYIKINIIYYLYFI